MEKDNIEKEVYISIVLDTRREKSKGKSKGKYPVKLRVYTSTPRIQILYPTKFEFTKSEFKSIWETTKPRDEYKEIRKDMRAVEDKAEETAKKIKPFNFDQFEKILYRNKEAGNNVFYHYDLIIKGLEYNNKFGTASNYDLSKKSLIAFLEYEKNEHSDKLEKIEQPEKLEKAEKLLFSEISVKWLTNYENYMIDTKGKSETTVSMYLRALRTVFNTAISDKSIDAEMYPFRRNEQEKNKYIIPTGKAVKKALDKDQLKKLFKAKPMTPEQVKAKDFWFFSYSCNGMNIKDIALLKYENLKNDTIEFYRAKTKRTTKQTPNKITVSLTAFAKSIIKKYGNKDIQPKQYIFNIVEDSQSEIIKFNRIKNFTKFINQNLKKLAIKEGITGDISTYWARHSMATQAIRNGASMEFVSEALGHNNMKTTQGYFAGFEAKDKKKLMEKLMKF